MCKEKNADQVKPDDSEWVFELLDRIFKESYPSADKNKENGITLAGSGENDNSDSEKVSDLLEKVFEENN
ncbi:MAG TPA: hypothetical protein VMT04_02205 [Terriglobales bacterium]|nr:hypothetical protein [Terriglobales bacterium]